MIVRINQVNTDICIENIYLNGIKLELHVWTEYMFCV